MEKQALHNAIRAFLQEDIGRGDITSEAIFNAHEGGAAQFVARQPLIAAGVASVAAAVFTLQNENIVATDAVEDGKPIQPGETLLNISGPVVDLLKAERTALNLLQRMCGIATRTRKFVEKVKKYGVKITDTRKTTPGLRLIEKYAVRAGGGSNHRFNLTDGVLIKDNHIAACGSIYQAVKKVRRQIPHTIRIEVETDTLDQVKECLECEVEIIMLDNMDVVTMEKAVKMVANRALVEASGGVTLESVENIAKTGVDLISVGALTHSAKACDIGMDWLSES